MIIDRGHDIEHAYVTGQSQHSEGHGGTHLYVTASQRWTPPDLIPEHRQALDEDDHGARRRKLLDLAKKPKPGTTIWRGEVRHKDDLEKPPSVGLHWSVNPDQVISPYDVPKDHHRVIWEAKVDHPDEQTIHRSHPIWYGRHQSMDSEAEIRLHPRAKVRVTRRYVHNGEGNSAQPYVRHPDRSDAGWTAHDMDHHADVAHKRAGDDGLMEYHKAYPDLFGEKPKPREGHSEVLYHGATYPRKFPIIAPDSFTGETHVRTSTDWNEAYDHASEKMLESYGSDDPDDHVKPEDIRVYRVEHRGAEPPHHASPTERHHDTVRILHDATEGPHVTGAKAAEPKLRFRHDKPTKNRTLQTLTVHHPKKGPVGRLEFYERPEHLEIQLLSVPREHRGNGYGNHLMDELQRRFPGKPIDHGERTDAGQGWWDSYSHGKEVVNGRTMASHHHAVSVSWDHNNDDPSTWSEDYRNWAKEKPHAAAVSHAQDHARRHAPTMEMELGSPEDATSTMQHMMRKGGHPDADEGFVMKHPNLGWGQSQAFISDGQPGVALHPSRWDYGTLAHETAHHLHMHELGRKPHDDEEAHGPDFIRHYQGTLADFGHGAAEKLGEHYHKTLGRIRNQASRRTASIPPEQRELMALPGGQDKHRKMLALAKDPAPGTHVWRGEVRHKDELHAPESVGLHWTVNPDAVVMRGNQHLVDDLGHSPDHRRVLWQGVVHEPERELIPRSHPIWSGRHQSFDNEAEVRYHPRAKVHLTGAYVYHGDGDPTGPSTAPPDPAGGESRGWSFHPMDHHAAVHHGRPKGTGLMDYQEDYPDLFGGQKRPDPPVECNWGKHPADHVHVWGEGRYDKMPTCHEHDAESRAAVESMGGKIKETRPVRKTAAREPSARLFGPTHGLDHRLFEGEHLKSDVRRYILETLGEFWKGKHGVDWDEWARVYFAGSEASEWTSESLEGNGDFDVLIGVDYDAYRGHQSRSETPKTDEEITDELNAELRMLSEKTKVVWIPVKSEEWPHQTSSNQNKSQMSSGATATAGRRPASPGISTSASPRSAGTSNSPVFPATTAGTRARGNSEASSAPSAVAPGTSPRSLAANPARPRTSAIGTSGSTTASRPSGSTNSLRSKGVDAASVDGRRGMASADGLSTTTIGVVPASARVGSASEESFVSGATTDSVTLVRPIFMPQSAGLTVESLPPLPDGWEWTGPWNGTWYVNHDSWDIRKIKPYAAYNVSDDVWAVKPPHLEDWDITRFPEGKAFLDEAHAVEAYVKAILAMPEPYRSQQGNALWEHLHSDRSRAFGPQGEGWYDPGNALEKYLDQKGLWEQLAAIHFNAKDHPEVLNSPANWSNDPRV